MLPIKKLEDYLKHNYAIAFTKTKEMNFKNMGKQIEPMLRSLELYRQKYPSNPFINKLYRQLKTMKENFERMGKFIVEERNSYVMKMLDQELKRVGNPKKPYTIAIFYGAAHFSDLSKRLAKRGYHQVGIEWLKAWRINSQR
ncbi:MAG: hypothetical protein D6785_08765 [Planctomycetota bacterium]|nr:MAG: hypothetical protein D6785_08765 [Planctomycetota bacterium]